MSLGRKRCHVLSSGFVGQAYSSSLLQAELVRSAKGFPFHLSSSGIRHTRIPRHVSAVRFRNPTRSPPHDRCRHPSESHLPPSLSLSRVFMYPAQHAECRARTTPCSHCYPAPLQARHDVECGCTQCAVCRSVAPYWFSPQSLSFACFDLLFPHRRCSCSLCGETCMPTPMQ